MRGDVESTRAELTACIKWFDALAAKDYSDRLASCTPSLQFITLDCAENLTHRQLKRHERLLDDERPRLARPFQRVRTFHHGLPVEVEWNAAPGDPLVGHPAWSIVESVIFSGPVALLPAFADLRDVAISDGPKPQ
ncbi:hypothetical protein JRI60_14135 [Archangium violaceum]|uniref:hypothetical protein n=1 Tax=Archangium violaceum TaxID=83451 RepID=UPI00194F13B7|nr:hypothetical protein [Archangium violaceum]QRO00067.1 hypothetical protein JRI60_14135 [Archangium violaceum]